MEDIRNGQMQGNDRITAVCRRKHKCGGVGALVVGHTVKPGQRIAGGPLIHAESRLVHRQRQHDDTVAAVDALQRVGVGARRGECGVEEAVAAALADCRRDRDVIDGVDRQC